jgi:hypothetical protein
MPAKLKPRTRPRVEETEPKSGVKKTATHRQSSREPDLTIEGGEIIIEWQGSELVPVAQYASVTIGPARVVRRIKDPGGTGDDAKAAIRAQLVFLKDLCEEVISEDRWLVEQAVARHNEREADNGKK